MSNVDIIRKHIGSDDFYDLNGTEMLSKILAAMDEYAQEQVKLFAIPDVSNSVCSCGSTNYGYGFAKCFDCGKIKDV